MPKAILFEIFALFDIFYLLLTCADVVVGFSQSVYTAHEGDGLVMLGLGRRGSTNLPVILLYFTQDDTATG